MKFPILLNIISHITYDEIFLHNINEYNKKTREKTIRICLIDRNDYEKLKESTLFFPYFIHLFIFNLKKIKLFHSFYL